MSLPGNSVAHAQCSIDSSWFSLLSMEQSEYDTLLAFCCDCKYPPECSKNEKDCIRRIAKTFIVKDGLLFYRDKHNKEYRVSFVRTYTSNDIPVYLNALGCHEERKNESSGRLS